MGSPGPQQRVCAVTRRRCPAMDHPRLRLPLLNSSSGRRLTHLRPLVDWGLLHPPNASLVGERWSLMISSISAGGRTSAVRRVLLQGSDIPPLRLGSLVDDTSTAVELRMCRICSKCSGAESISSGWRLQAHCRLNDG
eukprot:4876672-Prymnesium_polylepis.1